MLTAHQLLEAYRREKGPERGKIITVLGCGGNRDKGKRPKMGEVASRLSDFVILTSDNPRNEDPRTIIIDIEKGIKGDSYIVIPDRNVAISMAVELASSGDICWWQAKAMKNIRRYRAYAIISVTGRRLKTLSDIL